MSVVVECPHCNKPIANNSSVAGKIVKCPNCTEKFQMPILAAPQSTAQPVPESKPDPLDFLESASSSTPSHSPPTSYHQSKPKKQSDVAWGKILGGAAAVLMLLMISVKGCHSGGGMMSREQFKQAVFDKSKDEVIKAVGRPDETFDNPSGGECWIYRYKTLNPVTGKPDLVTKVYVPGGYASGISYGL